MSKAVVPRNFVLLQELEDGQKNADGFSFGLFDDDDVKFYLWNASILRGDQVYPLVMYCGDRYPDEPPKVAFTHKVSSIKHPTLKVADVINPATGDVNLKNVPGLGAWSRNNTFEHLLKSLKSLIKSGSAPGAEYDTEPAWLKEAKSKIQA